MGFLCDNQFFFTLVVKKKKNVLDLGPRISH